MRPRPWTCIITAATHVEYTNAKLIKHSVGARRQHHRLVSTMANRPAYRVRLGRWIRGRCSQCGARGWAARHDGHTVPEPVCRRFGYRPQGEADRELGHHLGQTTANTPRR